MTFIKADRIFMCTFNENCIKLDDGAKTMGHRPAIGSSIHCGCPFPGSVGRMLFHKGDILFRQGDAVRGAYTLTSGSVAVERVDADGKNIVLKVLRAGAFFPCADLFGDNLHGSEARALTDVQVCFIPMERIAAALNDPALRTTLFRCSADEARDNENAMFRLAAGNLGDRVLAALEAVIETPANFADRVEGILSLCWRDVAAMVGTSPEVMSRTIRRLQKDGRLKVDGRRLTIYASAIDETTTAPKHSGAHGL